MAGDDAIDLAPQPTVEEIAARQRPAGGDGAETAQVRPTRHEPPPRDGGADLFELADMHEIGRIVYEAGEMDAVTHREMAQEMPSADLLPLIGRIGDAVGKEEQVFHFSRSL
jgi:hypothetical protein